MAPSNNDSITYKKHMKEAKRIGGRECMIYQEGEQPAVLLIQPIGAHEQESINNEMALIAERVDVPLVMAAFSITNWELELSPWHDPALSRDKEVGDRACETLRYVTDKLMPSLIQDYGKLPIVLGGYSLAGLFALWAAHESSLFNAVAAVSPSVWIAGWREFALQHPVKATDVYLSLGDREERTRNRAFAQVGDNIRFEYELLQKNLGMEHCTLEWNPGNHFADNALRTAKGFEWCIEHISQSWK